MILADADILSALAKVTRLPLLFSLLQATSLQIAPAVFRELAQSRRGTSGLAPAIPSKAAAEKEILPEDEQQARKKSKHGPPAEPPQGPRHELRHHFSARRGL